MLHHPRLTETPRHFTSRDIPDCLWPTDNDAGIPTLRRDLCADAADLPITGWGTLARSKRMFGTYHFYVDDYRFNGLWKDPSAILNSGCVNVVEPNFTVHDQLPNALALYYTYKKRWLARTWQELGNIRVFVDLNVPPGFAAMNLLGVPQGWRAYADRGYADKLPDLLHDYRLACNHAGSSEILFLVYGGGKNVRDFCIHNAWIWVPEQQDVAQRRLLAASVANTAFLPSHAPPAQLAAPPEE